MGHCNYNVFSCQTMALIPWACLKWHMHAISLACTDTGGWGDNRDNSASVCGIFSRKTER